MKSAVGRALKFQVGCFTINERRGVRPRSPEGRKPLRAQVKAASAAPAGLRIIERAPELPRFRRAVFTLAATKKRLAVCWMTGGTVKQEPPAQSQGDAVML